MDLAVGDEAVPHAHRFEDVFCVGAADIVGVGHVSLPGGVATCVAEELTDGDGAGRPVRERIEMLRHLVVQVDLACLDQLRDGKRREARGDRTGEERGIRRDAFAAPPDDTSRTADVISPSTTTA
jgi:hypothetical protein